MNPKCDVLMVVLNSVLHDSRVLREASTLLSSGYKVNIIGIRGKNSDLIKTNMHVELIHIWSRDMLPKNIIGWLIKYFEFCLKAIIRIILLKPGIVHAHDLNTLFPAYIASLLTRSSIIYDSHELYTEQDEFSDNLINRIWRHIEKKLLHQVSAVIAANKSRARIMKRDYGAPEMPTDIMNIPAIQFTDRSYILHDYLKGIGVDSLDQNEIALYQGGISHDRSLDFLIRSVKDWNQKIILILMGYGEESYIDDLKRLIDDLDLQQRVFFHPAVPSHRLLQYTASANIGIVIYKNTCRNNYYCAPNKLFEYAAANLKIAGCNFPEVTNLIHKYSLGCTFDSEDEDDIAECINDLSDLKIDKANYKQLFLDYNWENEENKLLQVYSKVHQNVFE